MVNMNMMKMVQENPEKEFSVVVLFGDERTKVGDYTLSGKKILQQFADELNDDSFEICISC